VRGVVLAIFVAVGLCWAPSPAHAIVWEEDRTTFPEFTALAAKTIQLAFGPRPRGQLVKRADGSVLFLLQEVGEPIRIVSVAPDRTVTKRTLNPPVGCPADLPDCQRWSEYIYPTSSGYDIIVARCALEECLDKAHDYVRLQVDEDLKIRGTPQRLHTKWDRMRPHTLLRETQEEAKWLGSVSTAESYLAEKAAVLTLDKATGEVSATLLLPETPSEEVRTATKAWLSGPFSGTDLVHIAVLKDEWPVGGGSVKNTERASILLDPRTNAITRHRMTDNFETFRMVSHPQSARQASATLEPFEGRTLERDPGLYIATITDSGAPTNLRLLKPWRGFYTFDLLGLTDNRWLAAGDVAIDRSEDSDVANGHPALAIRGGDGDWTVSRLRFLGLTEYDEAQIVGIHPGPDGLWWLLTRQERSRADELLHYIHLVRLPVAPSELMPEVTWRPETTGAP